MIFRIDTMPWSGSSVATEIASIYNYVSQYDNRFTLDTSTNIMDFDGLFGLTVAYGNYGRPTMTLVCSNTGASQYTQGTPSGSWNNSNSKTVTFISTTNLVYCRVNLDSSNYTGFMWVEDSSNNSYGGVGNTVANIDSTNFYDTVGGGATVYNLGKYINFAAPSGKVYYTELCTLATTTGGSVSDDIDYMMSCSTITTGQTITISGNNYYTLGNHVLLSLAAP